MIPLHCIIRLTKMSSEKEEAEAQAEIWKYVFGFTEMAVVKCAIELGIPDVLDRHPNQTMSLHALSAALACSPPSLHRIMRFLTRRRIFKQLPGGDYAQSPLSRLLRRNGEKTLAPLLLFESTPVMLAPWHNLKDRVLSETSGHAPPFSAAHGQDVWEYAEANPGHSELLNEAMACDARLVVGTLLGSFAAVFDGVGTVVDVGGGDGTALRTLIGGLPAIQGINYDLPHVVSVAPVSQGIEHVGGDFFQSVPNADAAFIMWVLHDWDDEECIKILKNCREATKKVIILEAVISEDEEEEEEEEGSKKLKDVGLMLDMIMMAHTSRGKERTAKEWAYVLDQAGFSRHTIHSIHAVQSVIQAYP